MKKFALIVAVVGMLALTGCPPNQDNPASGGGGGGGGTAGGTNGGGTGGGGPHAYDLHHQMDRISNAVNNGKNVALLLGRTNDAKVALDPSVAADPNQVWAFVNDGDTTKFTDADDIYLKWDGDPRFFDKLKANEISAIYVDFPWLNKIWGRIHDYMPEFTKVLVPSGKFYIELDENELLVKDTTQPIGTVTGLAPAGPIKATVKTLGKAKDRQVALDALIAAIGPAFGFTVHSPTAAISAAKLKTPDPFPVENTARDMAKAAKTVNWTTLVLEKP